MNIYQRMSAATNEIMAVSKNLNVGYGKSQYKAVGEADVLAAVKPIEVKHGIYSYPAKRAVIESAVLTTEREGRETRQQFMRIETVYRFVNVEDPADFIEVITLGDGVDPQDKAPGKAMTYADKYALLKAYKIITGDDPDQKASDTLKAKAINHQTIDVLKATAIRKACEEVGIDPAKVAELYSVNRIEDLTEAKHSNLCAHWAEVIERCKA